MIDWNIRSLHIENFSILARADPSTLTNLIFFYQSPGYGELITAEIHGIRLLVQAVDKGSLVFAFY